MRTNRNRLGLTQDEVADAIGVVRKTISRWENQSAKPETYETAEAAIVKLGMDRETALRAAGFAPKVPGVAPADPYAYVREMGLDPANRVVRRILAARVDEEFRMRMLRRERQLQIRDEQARLDDVEWTIDQQGDEDDQRRAS